MYHDGLKTTLNMNGFDLDVESHLYIQYILKESINISLKYWLRHSALQCSCGSCDLIFKVTRGQIVTNQTIFVYTMPPKLVARIWNTGCALVLSDELNKISTENAFSGIAGADFSDISSIYAWWIASARLICLLISIPLNSHSDIMWKIESLINWIEFNVPSAHEHEMPM